MQIIRLTALIFLVLGASACREEEQGRTLSFDKTYSGTPMPLIDNKVGDKLRQRVAMQDF